MSSDYDAKLAAAGQTSGTGLSGADLERLTNAETVDKYNDTKALASLVNLTNNSGGTSGGNTVAAVSDVATAANAIATLTVKLNAVIDALQELGEDGE